MNKPQVLQLCDIEKSYKIAGSKELKIFEGVDLNISESELVGIIAPSGTGKTSLLIKLYKTSLIVVFSTLIFLLLIRFVKMY